MGFDAFVADALERTVRLASAVAVGERAWCSALGVRGSKPRLVQARCRTEKGRMNARRASPLPLLWQSAPGVQRLESGEACVVLCKRRLRVCSPVHGQVDEDALGIRDGAHIGWVSTSFGNRRWNALLRSGPATAGDCGC